ncbi:glycosyltransferase [Microbulbifer sp. SH-1]|uniref:glycosyltransferase family 2 protein n=1 Tax=Microbulbifer sp. SH-1 TaxID=2681547 RepID=UPI00140D469A|nr:glycosyltransferase family 2 protein [Microbulbifer sp. SH-1]QIL89355.1 glycosyltransferase [Microbulbifer sp. SH-1]
MISVVVTFHNERTLAQITLNSILRCRKYCEKFEEPVQLVVVLDSVDAMTKKIVESHPCVRPNDVLLNVNYGDLGFSRNRGISAADGEFVAILDGDDLYSENWLYAAKELIKRKGKHIVCHPEIVVNFGKYNSYAWQIDQEDAGFDPDGLLLSNYWTSWVVAHKEVFASIEYAESNHRQQGFGHEDWHWNCCTIKAGYIHKVVPQTSGFYRRKHSSLLSEQLQNRVYIRKTNFFHCEI